MLPDYNTCIDRIKAYNQTQVYNRKREEIGKSKQPLEIAFGGFWRYKEHLENMGHGILDDEHLHETASKLYDFLDDWGMRQTGIAKPPQIEDVLKNIRWDYVEIRDVKLGGGEMGRHRKHLAIVYKGLTGITNRRRTEYPDGSRSGIAGKSKTLLAVWGQTPGFDRLTRKNFRTWTYLSERKTLPHCREEGWCEPDEFCDILEELDDWVVGWPEGNDGRVFADSFADLCPGLPVGRIIDMIYNWEFEHDPLKYYLYLLEDCGEQEKTLSFKEVEGVTGFDLAQLAYEASPWWEKNIGTPLYKSQSKRRRDDKPSWEMAPVDVREQEVVFALLGPERKLTTTSIGAASLEANSKEVSRMNQQPGAGQSGQAEKRLSLDCADRFARNKELTNEADYIKSLGLSGIGTRDAVRCGLYIALFQSKGCWDACKDDCWKEADEPKNRKRAEDDKAAALRFVAYLQAVADGQRPPLAIWSLAQQQPSKAVASGTPVDSKETLKAHAKDKKYCIECGHDIPKKAKFCPECGEQQP